MIKAGRSKHWKTMIDILDARFPKGECRERGAAIIMVAYIDMMLQGIQFAEDGRPKEKTKNEDD